VEGAAPASPPPKPSSLRREITREQQASAAVAPLPAPDAEAGPPQRRRRYRRRGRPPPGIADAGAASSLPPDARAHVQRVLDESPRCRTDRSVPREYCAQMPAAALEEGLVNLLRTLMRFQQRQVHRKPTMAKARRRLLLGLRQCLRASHTGHLKALVLATNLEAYGVSAYFSMIVTFRASFLNRDAPVWILYASVALDNVVTELLDACDEHNIPVVFALSRRRLGTADTSCTLPNGQVHRLISKVFLSESLMHRRVGDWPAAASQRRRHPPRRRCRGPATRSAGGGRAAARPV